MGRGKGNQLIILLILFSFTINIQAQNIEPYSTSENPYTTFVPRDQDSGKTSSNHQDDEVVKLKGKIRTIIALNLVVVLFLIFILIFILIRRQNQKKRISQELELAYSQLEKMAVLDGLTGLYNKRSMTDRIEIEIVRMGRTWKPFCIVMFDIDNFSEYNKLYGEECGDKILQAMSILIKNHIREQDSVSRWGGEEFLVLLPETSAKGGFTLAEKIRKTVEDSELKYGESTIKFTVTAGINVYNRPGPVSDCIRAADMALYRGKNKGKNVVLLSE